MKIDRASKAPVRVILILLGVLAFGLAFGSGIENAAQAVFGQGFLSSWKLLDGVTDFQKIVEATSQEVWAETNAGQLYYWNSNCDRNPTCNVWIKTEVVPEELHTFGETPIEVSDSCQGPSVLEAPPGKIVECVHARFLGPELGTNVYYALLENGTVWRLGSSYSFHQSLCLGALFVLLFGIVVLATLVRRLSTKKKAK